MNNKKKFIEYIDELIQVHENNYDEFYTAVFLKIKDLFDKSIEEEKEKNDSDMLNLKEDLLWKYSKEIERKKISSEQAREMLNNICIMDFEAGNDELIIEHWKKQGLIK